VRTYRISLGDVPIGQLIERAGGSAFIYDLDAVSTGIRPPLSQSLLDQRGRPLDAYVDDGLVPFFQNIIPEDGPLRRYLAERNGVNQYDSLALLAVLGDNLPGAVRALLLDDAGEPAHAPDPVEKDPRWRFSLAGVQMKFSAARLASGGWALASLEHPGEWIVKLASSEHANIVTHEYTVMRLARLVGHLVPHTELIDLRDIPGLSDRFLSNGTTAYAIRRFDRGPNRERIHQEDFCQILNLSPRRKYGDDSGVTSERVATIIQELCGPEDAYEWVRRLAFTIAVGNGDAHLKNHAIYYPDGFTPRLSPIFDVLCTLAYQDYDRDLALSIGGEYAFNHLSRDAIAAFSRQAGLGEKRVFAAFQDVSDRLRDVWPDFRESIEIPDLRTILEHRITNVLPAILNP
jgi:serine/threonine-protein kinase HipA